MIAYDIVHHIAGRIRLKVPLMRKLVFAKNLPDHIKDLSFISLPSGIKDIRANPFAESLVITYEPEEINVLEFVKSTIDTLSTNAEIQKILGGIK
ncbi:MAG TPA: hypothetical protein VJ440_05545 [Candidatus Brocadiaceae bacterium]|nr:hypothetical protein [Candidatus Brocadiaceae bacterium]